jgi:hypothetical protein
MIGGAISSSGAQSAARTQADAANRSADLQKEMFDEQKRLSEPYRQAGLTGQNRLMELLGLGGNTGAAGYGQYSRDFGMQDFQQDPGYQFRLGEGLKAMGHRAGARGGLISGQTMKGMEDYRQASASQEYGNAFNRYQIERSARLNPLQSLMGSGQSATNVMTGNVGQSSQNEQGNIMGAGQARASGYVGSANALGGALSSIGQAAASYPLMQAQMNYFNALGRGGGGGGGSVIQPYAAPGLNVPPTYMPSFGR